MNSDDNGSTHEFRFHDDMTGSSVDGQECASADPSLLAYHCSPGKPLGVFSAPPAPAQLCWNARYVIETRVGQGAQGVVYRARHEGSDGYKIRVALKVFNEYPHLNSEEYVAEMHRIARQAEEISRIQQDNVVCVRDFVAIDEMRVMVLEWIDGLDLSRLLSPRRMSWLRRTLPPQVWDRLNDVVVTEGEDHCRVKPGIAVYVLQQCLAGISSLHQHEIVHCDLKPSNIMINRNGVTKIVDLDSSLKLSSESEAIRGTPYYMAPEQLRGEHVRPQSDLAGLGYVFIELLTGRCLFKGCETREDLLQRKLALPDHLEECLSGVVCKDSILYQLARRMIAVNLKDRFADANVADLDRFGSARFLRQLIEANLFAEYGRELAWWLQLPHCCERSDAATMCPCPAPCPISDRAVKVARGEGATEAGGRLSSP